MVPSLVSLVKGVRAGTLLSPDVHIKDNRPAEKKIRDQASQTAGNAKKSHKFQYGGVEGSVAALETKLVTETLKHGTHEYPTHSSLYTL